MPRKRGPRGVAPPEVATRQIHLGIISLELAMLAVLGFCRRWRHGLPPRLYRSWASQNSVSHRMFRLRET
jgi:hypothetical protein